ncbi:MAG: hypothetical protein H6744_00505 [Deltaproteobacteria bacterium]|nr:hypothetical protein [Deltaproteobacteria bacterium]MCB9785146.1 hypothetical protein [Deltaproteobacteria bacterium]
MTQVYPLVSCSPAPSLVSRTAFAPARDLLVAAAPLAAAARELGRDLDPEARLRPSERFAMAVALLWSWQAGVELASDPLRLLAEGLFARLPAAANEAMAPWCFEPWRVIPDRRGPGALVRSLTSDDVVYRVARVCVLGPVGHQPPTAPRGTCLGWLVPVGDEPALLSFYQPRGRRLGRLRELLADDHGGLVFSFGASSDAHALHALLGALGPDGGDGDDGADIDEAA